MLDLFRQAAELIRDWAPAVIIGGGALVTVFGGLWSVLPKERSSVRAQRPAPRDQKISTDLTVKRL